MSLRSLSAALLVALLSAAAAPSVVLGQDVRPPAEEGVAAAPAAGDEDAEAPAGSEASVAPAEPRAERSQAGEDPYGDPFPDEEPPPAAPPGAPTPESPSGTPPGTGVGGEVAQVPGDATAADGSSTGSSSGAQLPNTGFPAGVLAGVGALLALGGAGLRRALTTRP